MHTSRAREQAAGEIPGWTGVLTWLILSALLAGTTWAENDSNCKWHFWNFEIVISLSSSSLSLLFLYATLHSLPATKEVRKEEDEDEEEEDEEIVEEEEGKEEEEKEDDENDNDEEQEEGEVHPQANLFWDLVCKTLTMWEKTLYSNIITIKKMFYYGGRKFSLTKTFSSHCHHDY